MKAAPRSSTADNLTEIASRGGRFEMVEEPESVQEPAPEETGSASTGGRLKRWTERLKELQGLVVAVGAVLLAVGAAVGAANGIFDGHPSPGASPQPSPSIRPDDSPMTPTVTPTTPSPRPSPSVTPSLNISVTCQLPGNLQQGQQTKATYTITSNQSIKAGLGLGVYDSGGTDYSNGDGDMDGYQLSTGTQSVSRDVFLPTGLDAGRYEIDAEIWPNGKIGADGVEVLAEGHCGYLNVS